MDIHESAFMKYKNTMHHRDSAAQQTLAERKARAWVIARRAAALLYEDFKATEVVLFGSLAHTFQPQILT